MTVINLAIGFGMGVAPDQGTNALGISPDFGIFQSMVRTWICQASLIFPDREALVERKDDSHTSNSADIPLPVYTTTDASPVAVNTSIPSLRRTPASFESLRTEKSVVSAE